MVKGTSFFSGFLGLLFGLWVVTLWILSSIPGQDIELPPFPGADKVAHFVYFFIGGLLFASVIARTRPLARLEADVDRAVCDRLDWSAG